MLSCSKNKIKIVNQLDNVTDKKKKKKKEQKGSWILTRKKILSFIKN